MLKLQDRSTSRVRRSAKVQARKQRFQVESLECRALLSGLTFTAAYGITGSGVQIYDIATDPSGNTYLTGYYTGNANFGTGSGAKVYNESDPGPSTEAFVVSYSPTGAVNWYDEFQNQSSDAGSASEGSSLTYDHDNQTVYVVGDYTGTVDFDPFGIPDPQTSSTDAVTGADARDAFLIGINATGASAGQENNNLITGGFGGFTDFASTQSSDMTIFGPIFGGKVTVNPAGDSVYVTGSYSFSNTNNGAGSVPVSIVNQYGTSIPLAQPATTSEGFTAVFGEDEYLYWAVNTYNSSGGTMDGAANYGVAFGIAPDLADPVDFIVGENLDQHFAFVEEVDDVDGSFVALKQLNLQSPGTNPTDYANSVVTDSAGNAYVVGTFSGTLVLPNGNLTSAGATNAFIVSFDDNLNELWGDRFGSSNQTAANGSVGDDGDGVAIDGASTPNIYVSGEVEGPATYGTSGTPVLGQGTSVQAYAIEVSSIDGSFISGAGATGTGASMSEAGAIAVGSGGQVVIAGNVTPPTTLGTLAIPAADSAFIANLSNTNTTTTPFDLAITNTDGATTYTAGGNTTYTIVVTNNGPTAVTGAAVNDLLPKSIASDTWTAVASTGSSVTKATGTGSIVNDKVSLLANGTVTFTVVAKVSSTATGNLVTTATVSTTATTPAGITDSNTANNTATDTDTPTTTTKAAAFDLGITINDGAATYTPGGKTTYTIVVSNNGPSAVTGAMVNDSLPAGIKSATWTTAVTKGATVKTRTGTGNIFNDLVDLPVGATVTFTVVATINATATGNLVTTATVSTTATTPKVSDSNTANNTAADTDTPTSTPTPTPTPKPVAPVFLGEQRIFKGKGKHKKLVGFEFRFNGALNAAVAQATGDYRVTQKNGKKLKVLPVKSATYSPSDFGITIVVGGFKTGKAAQATVTGLVGANGAAIAQIVSGL